MTSFLKYFPILLLAGSLLSCKTPLYQLESSEPRRLDDMFRRSEIFQKQFTGFALFDPVSEEYLYQYHSNLLFTPASNVKILTLLCGMEYLGDSTLTFAWQRTGDSLFVWPAGDPTFLHPDFQQNPAVVRLLKDAGEVLILQTGHYIDLRLGAGWAWDDYPFTWQSEKSPLPVYGNRVEFWLDTITGAWQTKPSFFEKWTIVEETEDRGWRVERDPDANSFRIRIGYAPYRTSRRSVPFTTYPYLLKELLEDTLGRPVLTGNLPLPDRRDVRWISNCPVDTVYRYFMWKSDNPIAEQLLLQAGLLAFDSMRTETLIRRARKELFPSLPDSVRWVDGSGLSRYNLLSPRAIVTVLHRLLQEEGPDILDMFPAGGRQGTIADYYHSDPPIVYAKSGTMSNKHNLSGFIKTASGRTLIFSFMNNHFPGSNRPVKREMERFLFYIHRNY